MLLTADMAEGVSPELVVRYSELCAFPSSELCLSVKFLLSASMDFCLCCICCSLELSAIDGHVVIIGWVASVASNPAGSVAPATSKVGGGEKDNPVLPRELPCKDIDEPRPELVAPAACAASAAVSSPLSSCLSSLKRAAASRIRLNSIQNACTSIKSS